MLLVGVGGGYFLGSYLTKTSTSTVDITEAGSTLLEPLMELWGPNYTSEVNSHVVLSPGPGGSGLGRTEAEAGTIDIGGSDAYVYTPATKSSPAVNASDLGVVNVPVAISSQLIVYNLSGVSQLAGVHLNLNGTILAEIFEGTITTWNNPLIKSANPSVAQYLPDTDIIPIYRSDSSGDTALFSTYCYMSWSGWTYGNSTGAFTTPAVLPPKAETGVGNSGIIKALLTYGDSIGYVGVSYMATIVSDHQYLQYAALGDNLANTAAGGNVTATPADQNNYVLWNATNVGEDATLGLANLNYAADGLAVNLILGGNPGFPVNWTIGKGGTNPTVADPTPYPIVNLEYAVVKLSPASPSHQAYVVNFLQWAISYGNYGSNGKASVWINTVGFLPLTPQLQGLDQQALAAVAISG